jgi:hypothetical protein
LLLLLLLLLLAASAVNKTWRQTSNISRVDRVDESADVRPGDTAEMTWMLHAAGLRCAALNAWLSSSTVAWNWDGEEWGAKQ